MANAKPKKNSEPGIMDVSKPGRAKPSATSKPIIITNRPLLQDPMVVEDEAKQDGAPASPAKSKVTIQPISVKTDEDEMAETVAVTTEPEEPTAEATVPAAEPEPVAEATEPAPEQPAADQAQAATEPPAAQTEAKAAPGPADIDSEPPAAKTEEATKSDTSDSDDGEKVDAVAAPMSPEAQDAAAKKAEEEKAAHEAAIQKLVDTEQYFLPIDSVENRKVKRFIALGAVLIVLLGAAWVDVALDAGLVQLGGLKPATHFFTAKPVSTTSKLLPKVTTKTYNAPVAKLSFRYESDWKLANSGSTAQADVVTLNPVASDPSASVAVSFLSQYTLGKGSFTVKYVHYQKLPHAISGTVYLRDMVYQDGFGNINLVASLGNDNSVKTGKTVQSIDQDFLNPDGKTRSLFAITVFKTSKGKVGFSSLAEAQQFISTTQYQQARNILLSTAPQK